jgi:hypothetical protein
MPAPGRATHGGYGSSPVWAGAISGCQTLAATFVKKLELLNQPVDAKLRVHFYQAMNVVGHDFQSQDLRPIFCCHFAKQLFAAFCNRTHQHSLYLGVQTQWYLLENTTLWFDLYPSSALY